MSAGSWDVEEEELLREEAWNAPSICPAWSRDIPLPSSLTAPPGTSTFVSPFGMTIPPPPIMPTAALRSEERREEGGREERAAEEVESRAAPAEEQSIGGARGARGARGAKWDEKRREQEEEFSRRR